MRAPSRAIAIDLTGLIVIAAALRLGIFLYVPNIHYPDEIFQVLEPAHRLVFGTGIVSWEWIFGIRSWLMPGVLAGFMEVGRLFGDRPMDTNLPPILFMIAASCAPVVCGYLWGRALFDRWGGLVTGGVAALWIDLIYMASHTLTEVLAADCLVVALYLGYPKTGPISRRRLFAAGLLLGLTFVLRFHLTPALAVAALGICGVRAWARWRTLIAGAAVPLILSGLLDWVTLGAPFQSIWLNAWMNVGLGISGEAGTNPFLTLFILPFFVWGAAGFVAMLIGAIVGVRRLPLLGLVVLAIFLTHAAIAHKEYRFTYPALPLLAILAGLGTAELLVALRARLPRLGGAVPAVLALVIWAALSLHSALGPIFDVPWTRERAKLEIFDRLSHQPRICGVGLYDVSWAMTPGQSWLPPAVSLYDIAPDKFAAKAPAFNAVIARRRKPVTDPRYRLAGCFANNGKVNGRAGVDLCLWERDGGCDASAAQPPGPNWPGYFTGQPPVLKEYDDDNEP